MASDETNWRAFNAHRMRLTGLTYREIGESLNVGRTQAKSLADRGERIMRFSRAPLGTSIEKADRKDFEIMRLRNKIVLLEDPTPQFAMR